MTYKTNEQNSVLNIFVYAHNIFRLEFESLVYELYLTIHNVGTIILYVLGTNLT